MNSGRSVPFGSASKRLYMLCCVHLMTLYQLLVFRDCERGAETSSALSSLLLVAFVASSSLNFPPPAPAAS
jgi:hypothetical protein